MKQSYFMAQCPFEIGDRVIKKHSAQGTTEKQILELLKAPVITDIEVYLSPEHHRNGPEAVHNCKDTRRRLEAAGQREFERSGRTRQEFMNIFGRNYL